MLRCGFFGCDVGALFNNVYDVHCQQKLATPHTRGRCSQLKTRTSSYQFESYVFLNLDSIFS